MVAYKLCYKDEKQYIQDKNNNYCNIQLDTPTVYTNALRINKIENNKWVGLPIDMYKSGNYYIKNESFSYKEYCSGVKYPRLCFNDWLLVSNRLASDYYFKDYFNNLFRNFNTDINNYKKDINYKWEMRSEHAMQGKIALNNNVNVFRLKPRRDIKIFNPNNSKIEAETDSMFNCHVDFDEQLQKRWPLIKK